MPGGVKEAKTAAPSKTLKKGPAPSPLAQSAQGSQPASIMPTRAVCPCGGGCPRCMSAAKSPQAHSPAVEKTAVRHRMEQSFGTSFQDVQLRTDPQASDRAQSLGARAYTDGKEIGFARGAFRPDTRDGLFTIAHEFAHVLQGRGGNVGSIPEQSSLGGSQLRLRSQNASSSHADPAEVNADSAARQVIAGRTPEVAPFAFEGRPRLIPAVAPLAPADSANTDLGSSSTHNSDLENAAILNQQELAQQAFAKGQIDQGNQSLQDIDAIKKQAAQAVADRVQAAIEAAIASTKADVQLLIDKISEAYKKAESLRKLAMAEALLQSQLAPYERLIEEYWKQIKAMIQAAISKQLAKEMAEKEARDKIDKEDRERAEKERQKQNVPSQPAAKRLDLGTISAQTGYSFQDGPFTLKNTFSVLGIYKVPSAVKLFPDNALNLDILSGLSAGVGAGYSITQSPLKTSETVSFQAQINVYAAQYMVNHSKGLETTLGIPLSFAWKDTLTPQSPDPNTHLSPSPNTIDLSAGVSVQQNLGHYVQANLAWNVLGEYHQDPGGVPSKSGVAQSVSLSLKFSWP